MPSLGAALVASLAGWLVDELVQPFLGTAVTVVVSLVCSTIVFFAARNWLNELRGR